VHLVGFNIRIHLQGSPIRMNNVQMEAVQSPGIMSQKTPAVIDKAVKTSNKVRQICLAHKIVIWHSADINSNVCSHVYK